MRIPAAAWMALGAGALAIRLYRLDYFSYWLDEILESFTIHDSWRELWGSLRWQGIQAPLDYAIAKLVDGFGTSDAARKLPAVFFGTGTVLAAGRLLTRRAGETAGFVTGILIAVSPFHVHYSQELRPYSLGMFMLCASLLMLEKYLAAPNSVRLVALYLFCLATAYALYVAALALLVAGGALVIEDCLSPDTRRSSSARRFLAKSPLFALALWIGFLPWWPVFLTGIRSAPMGIAPRFSAARIPRIFSFFGFAHADWESLGWKGLGFSAGCFAGFVVALRKPGTRFLLAWSLAGFTLMELLEQRHPIFDSIFHYTPMGISLVALFGLSLSGLISHPLTRRAGLALLILAVVLDVGSLREYFRSGRPDWRPLGAYLRATPTSERIVTENSYSMLCVAYYVVGPNWMRRSLQHSAPRSIVSLDGAPAPMAWLWEPGKTAWLVLWGSGPSDVKRWAEPYPGVAFPTAEGGAVVKRLDRRR